MRVSTQSIYAQMMRSLNQQQGNLLQVGQQIASGRRVVRPSDDPQAASRAVQLNQAQAVTDQYTSTRVHMRNALSLEGSVLGSVGDAITSAKTRIIQANSDTLSDADRQSIASQLQSIFHTVLGQANAADGNGRYVFGGYENRSTPFVLDSQGNVTFQGNGFSRAEKIDASRLMPSGDDGHTIFDSARYQATSSNDQVQTQAIHVTNANAPAFGRPFTIVFGGSTSYHIEDAAGQHLTPEETFDPDKPVIKHAGLSIAFEGTPANGDHIYVDKSQAAKRFMAVAGSNHLEVMASDNNTGAATFSNLKADPTDASLDGNPFTVYFTDANHYDIYNQAHQLVSPANHNFTSGDTIAYNGVSVDVDGTPAAGDTFTVGRRIENQPSTVAFVDDNNNGNAKIEGGPYVVDASDPNYGQSFQIKFTDATTYDIEDQNGNTLESGITYTDGDVISYAGVAIKMDNTGSPDASGGDMLYVNVAHTHRVAGGENKGSITFDKPDVINSNDPDFGQPFTIEFNDDGSKYTIYDAANKPVGSATNLDYTDGDPIEYAGVSVVLDGKAEGGDTVQVGRPGEFNTNVFDSFNKAIKTLNNPASTASERAHLHNVLNNVMAEFDGNLNNVLTVRASVGARMNELDVIDQVSDNRTLNYKQAKSDLVDLDYVQAISEYSIRMAGMQAAQKAFVSMKGLSLFNYM